MRHVKDDLMVSNRYVDVTTLLIDISEKQGDFKFYSISRVIDSFKETNIPGRNIRIQAARLLDVITDDRSTYEDIKKLEITDLCTFLDQIEKAILTSYHHEVLLRKEIDPIKVAMMRVIEVICSIIIYGREYNKEKDNEMPFPEELYHLDEDPNITEWYEKEETGSEKRSNTGAP